MNEWYLHTSIYEYIKAGMYDTVLTAVLLYHIRYFREHRSITSGVPASRSSCQSDVAEDSIYLAILMLELRGEGMKEIESGET